MATFVPLPNTASATVHYIQIGQRIQNTLYFHNSSAWTPTLMQDLADKLWNVWCEQMMIDLSSSLVMKDVTVIDQTTATSGTAVHTEDCTGSDGGGPYTPNDAFVLKLLTASRGRSFRGRLYIPGLTSNMVSSLAVLNASNANSLRDDLQGIITGVEDALGVTGVVASRYSGVDVNHKPIPRVTGISTPITSVAYTDLFVDSQRRRLPGRGI